MTYRRAVNCLAATLACAAALLPRQTLAQNNNLATDDVVLPAGYVIEPVLTGLSYPTSIAVGPDGALYMAESGYSYGQYWTDARILRLSPSGRVHIVASGFRAPIMGLTFHNRLLYVAHRGAISTVDLSTLERGRRPVRDIVTGLPVVPNGQHFNSPVTFGPDGKMYFAVGAVTNSSVPGLDDVIYGWLPDMPWMRDAPAHEVTLTGSDYRSPDVLGPDPLKMVGGGAFLPFGTSSRAGQVIPAHPKPSAAVYRANADGSGLEVYAWGIRSPFGFAFGPDGRLYMTDQAVDDKGARGAANAPDVLWTIEQHAWYGWPDYLGGQPITEERFKPRFPLSRDPAFVQRDHPEVRQPLVRFEPHAAATKFDWSKSERFGFRGEMFLAEFGDGMPITTGLRPIPHKGFRIVRVNTATGAVEPFMTINNPGSEDTRGPKRPIQTLFDASGDNLYLLDFGALTVRLTGKEVGIRVPPQTGGVWRIRRQETAAGANPPAAARVEGARLLSWWTVRALILGIQRDMRVALVHANRARLAGVTDMRYSHHREEARGMLEQIRTVAVQAIKRIDDPKILDDGTHFLLHRVNAWATAAEPVHLRPDDPMIREVERWIERTSTSFPEKQELFQSYALPGRWQRPLERDIKP